MFGFERNVAVLANSPNGDCDMNQQVLIGRRVDLEAFLGNDLITQVAIVSRVAWF